MNTASDLLRAATELPIAEQAALLTGLYDAIPPEHWPRPTAADLREATRIGDEAEAGRIATEDWQIVRERVRRQTGLNAKG